MLLSDALAYIFRGNTSELGWYMVRFSNLFVYICNFSISFFVCFYVCEFIKQSRLSLTLIFHPKTAVKKAKKPAVVCPKYFGLHYDRLGRPYCTPIKANKRK